MTASPEQEIQSLEEIRGSEHDPEGRVFVHLAEARRRNGELDEAMELLDEGLERHPDFSSGHVVAAWVRRDRGEAEEAEAAFRRVLELDEENTAALRGLGELAEARGAAGDALERFRKLAALMPEDEELAGRVRRLQEEVMGEEAAALSEMDEIMAGPAGDVEEFVRMDSMGDLSDLADILTMGQEPEAELPEEEPGAELPDEEPEAELPAGEAQVYTRTMGELYARQGLLDRALEIYEHLVQERPDEPALLERLEELRERAAGGAAAPGAAGGAWSAAPIESAEDTRSADEEMETLARAMSSGEGAAGELSTPFAWEEEETGDVADEGTGEPVSRYFARLLSWEGEAGGEVVPIESLAPDHPRPAGGAHPPVAGGAVRRDVVPIEALAPAGGDVVPVESLAPDHPPVAGGAHPRPAGGAHPPVAGGPSGDVVPIESLAPDPAPGEGDFSRWLERLE